MARSIAYGVRNAPYHVHGMLTTNWAEIWEAAGELARARSVSPSALVADMVHTQWSLGFTPKDYLLMALQDRTREEGADWVGTVDMYRAQKIWNPIPVRHTLMDKGKFAQVFGTLMDPRRLVVRDRRQAPSLVHWIDDLDGSAMISKPVGGQSGRGVLRHSIVRRESVEVDGNTVTGRWLESLGLPRVFDETGAVQNHPILSDVYSGSLNTSVS